MSNSSCFIPDWYPSVQAFYYNFQYSTVTPIYFVLGLSGHFIFLYSLYRHSKSDNNAPLFLYQLVLSVGECVVIAANFLYGFGIFLSITFPAYSRCYACLWYRAHLAVPLLNAVSNFNLMAAILMTADRVRIMKSKGVSTNPTSKRKYKIQSILSVIGALLISIVASCFDVSRFDVVPDGPTSYKVVVNLAFAASAFINGLSYARSALIILGLIVSTVYSILLIQLVRAQVNESVLGNISTSVAQKRKAQEKTLTQLTLSQNFVTVAYMTVMNVYYIFVYAYPDFFLCYRSLLTPIIESVTVTLDTVCFYMIFVISKGVRKMVRKAFPKFNGQTTSVITM